ncbi:bifunctional serine/threonine-protein kinase/formylglycine-generating enzyme family protein [Myxococcota bacterium]|nr:bifunctional serine/threonine-protein kinase/formylglycine-generating enzyme family protein [Myxococcota bacterium]
MATEPPADVSSASDPQATLPWQEDLDPGQGDPGLPVPGGNDADASPGWACLLPPRYRYLRPLGKGGMGEVVRVYDKELQREVAMKLLRPDRLPARGRFERESRIQAMLQHPSIVPLYDRGVLQDGRPWYTMQEVRGDSFRQVIDRWWMTPPAVSDDPPEPVWTLNRLVGVLAMTARAVAYAHDRGVVHRDLKPDNLMIGEHGGVLVLDWGIARLDEPSVEELPPMGVASGMTNPGGRLGTPGYMAPEQGHGLGPQQGPASDVYAQGAMLWEILARRRPEPGDILADHVLTGPAALCSLARLAVDPDPRERPTGAAWALALERWLDGSRRRYEAKNVLSEALAKEQEPRRLRALASELRAQAAAMDAALPDFATEPIKAPMWAAEDQAAEHEERAALLEVEVLQGARAALRIHPDLDEAHDVLAIHYHRQVRQAEQRGDAAARAHNLALLRAHDRGRFAAWLEGKGRVTLITDPPGARVVVLRLVERGRRHREVEVSQAVTPLREHVLDVGTYVLRIEADGCEPVRYPVLIESLEHWDGRAPGEDAPRTIRLPRKGELRPGELFVPAGWCVLGGDAEAIDALPQTRRWLEGFVIGRTPVTFAEYMTFLDALSQGGQHDRALELVPGNPLTVASGIDPVLHWDGQRWSLPADTPRGWTPQHPVVLVDHAAAGAYAAWAGGRLPTDDEWEKAARGVDGRRYPWGQHFDPCFTNLQASREQAEAQPVGQAPADQSPYGVLDVAGNVREWCANAYARRPDTPPKVGWRMVRGGAFSDSAARLPCLAGRYASPPDGRYVIVSFRVARDLADRR